MSPHLAKLRFWLPNTAITKTLFTEGDLDEDRGSVYDRRLNISSSPLEILYDMKELVIAIFL